jgi:hypothetical protein
VPTRPAAPAAIERGSIALVETHTMVSAGV